MHVQLSEAGIYLITFSVGELFTGVMIDVAATVFAIGVAATETAAVAVTLAAMVTNAVRTKTDLLIMVFPLIKVD